MDEQERLDKMVRDAIPDIDHRRGGDGLVAILRRCQIELRPDIRDIRQPLVLEDYVLRPKEEELSKIRRKIQDIVLSDR